MKLRGSTVALLLIASCLSLPTATLSFPGVDTENFSCPTGFIPVNDFGGPPGGPIPAKCVVDKCYGNPGPCGAGKRAALDIWLQPVKGNSRRLYTKKGTYGTEKGVLQLPAEKLLSSECRPMNLLFWTPLLPFLFPRTFWIFPHM
jgi:hypothetical protein